MSDEKIIPGFAFAGSELGRFCRLPRGSNRSDGVELRRVLALLIPAADPLSVAVWNWLESKTVF